MFTKQANILRMCNPKTVMLKQIKRDCNKSIIFVSKLLNISLMKEQKILAMIPDVTPEEMMFLVNVMSGLNDENIDQFLFVYKGKRKGTQEVMLMTLVGFLGIAGIQRFMLKQIGMGIIFLLTIGFCYIGTIVDLINHKSLAAEYNQQMAIESMQLMQLYRGAKTQG